MKHTALTADEYTGTGADASLTVSIDAETAPTDDQSIVLAQGGSEKKFSNLNSFTIQNSDNFEKYTTGGVINSASGSTITFTDVKHINLGTATEALNNSNPVLHGFSGTVSITGAEDLNIYSVANAIVAQQSGDNQAGNVNIKAQNVHIETNAVSVNSAAYGDQADGKVTSLKIDAGDSIYIESEVVGNGAASALQIGDTYTENTGDTYNEISCTGTADMTITAENDITLIGGNENDTGYGVSVLRKASAGSSELKITSKKGSVNISGDQVGLFTQVGTQNSNAEIKGSIQGKEVNIRSGKHALYVERTNDFSVKGDLIHISGGTNAVRVKKGSNVTLAGIDKESTIILDSTDKGHAINVTDSDSKLKIGDGTTKTDVYVNGYMTVTDGATATFAEGTTTHVDSKYLIDETDENKVFITTGNGSGTVNLNGKLDIGKVATGTELNFSDSESLNQAAKDNIHTDNVLQYVTVGDDGKMSVSTVSSEGAHKALAGSLLTDVALYATEKNVDGVTTLLTGENDVEALNSAAGLSAMAGVEHGTYTAAGIFNDAVAGHLMNRNDEDVWAYGFHNKENVNGLSFGADYDAQYNGAVAGVDLYRKGGTAAGIALSYADGNVSGSNGFASTQNDADYYGASLYARFDRGSYALLGDISYMKGDHDVTQWNKGQQITASPDSDAVSVGVKAVKDFTAGGSGTLTPYIGVRYLRLSTDGFTAYNASYSGDDQDLVLIPVGVNYSAAITGGSWTFRPYAGVGYIWNAGDKSADQTVTLGTAANSFSYDTVDSGSFLTRVGFTADHGDMSYGVGYSYQKGDSVSNNAWTLSASFRF